jgi:VWFA-related protein
VRPLQRPGTTGTDAAGAASANPFTVGPPGATIGLVTAMVHRAGLLIALSLATLLFAAGPAGQQQTPSQQQPPAQPPAQQQSTPPAEGQGQPQRPPTFRTGTNLVRVDVNVLGRNGMPLTDLTSDDFELKEDGQPQAITSFKLVSATGQPTDELSLPIRSPEHAATEAARDEVRVFLIFWDDYHINEFISTLRAREQLTKFVLEAFGPTDLVAIMDPLTTLDSIRFTRDRRELAEQVHKLKGRRGVYIPPRSVIEEAHMYYRGGVERARAEVTASALRAAAAHLGTLKEGRKTIIFVSESLGALGTASDRMQAVSDIIRMANDHNTAIYHVDPRGLQVANRGSARVSDELITIAANTGADSIVSNDMTQALKQVVVQSSAFYLLGYSPDKAAYDGKFHNIKVRVKRPNTEVRARAGYWAPRAEDVARAVTAAAEAKLPTEIEKAFAELTPANSKRYAEIWHGLAPGAQGRCDIRLAWTPRGSRDGTAAGSVAVEASNDEGELYAGELGESGITIDVPPGFVDLVFTVRDAAGEVIDREKRQVLVPNAQETTLALGTPVVYRARTAMELRAITTDAAALTFAGREFERTDRLRVRVAPYGWSSEGAEVSARLIGARGKPLADLPIKAVTDMRAYELDLPLTQIASGSFLISIEARKGNVRAEALVPIRIR